MATVRSKNTKPEKKVRSILHAMGYRFRLHGGDLPGTPDIVFKSRRKAIFVHGCFWHRHDERDCKLTRTPKSRQAFWTAKFEQNVARDKANQSKLNDLGWRFLVVWECEIAHKEQTKNKLVVFLEGDP